MEIWSKKAANIRFVSNVDWFPIDFMGKEPIHNLLFSSAIHFYTVNRNVAAFFGMSDNRFLVVFCCLRIFTANCYYITNKQLIESWISTYFFLEKALYKFILSVFINNICSIYCFT